MSKILGGAAIGFVVCCGLAFLVGTIVFASYDDVDSNIAFFAVIMIGSLAGFVGAVIGGSVVAYMEERNIPHQQNSPRRSRKWCKSCGSRLWDNSKTCEWCGTEVSWPSKE